VHSSPLLILPYIFSRNSPRLQFDVLSSRLVILNALGLAASCCSFSFISRATLNQRRNVYAGLFDAFVCLACIVD